jgi:hypothetical protein
MVLNQTTIMGKLEKKNNRIIIAGSLRFEDEIMAFAFHLHEKGYDIIYYTHTCSKCSLPKECNFYNNIRKTDTLLIFSKDGYIGNSVHTEIGIAYALGKKILSLEELKIDKCVRSLIKNLDE